MKTSTILAWGILIIVVAMLALYAIYPSTYSAIFSMATSTPAGGAKGSADSVTFYCQEGQISATFDPTAVQLSLSDGRYFALPQVMSGSGIRYEATTTGKDELFESEGSWAMLAENGKSTYSNCVAAHVADAGNGFKTYLDQSGTFSFTYPNAFAIVGTEPGYTQDWMLNATSSGMLLAEVQLPKSAEPGTNFGDAKFTVGTSADPSAVATCLSYNPSGGPTTAPTTVAINGVTFDKFTSNDAAAGNRYDTTSYRLIRDGQCYAIEYTIHYGVFENYPPGSITHFDEAAVAAQFQSIVSSFKFLQ